MTNRWLFFISSRYFKTQRKEKGFAPSLLSIVGIALGVMTLITVIGVMNGFQIGFIEDILGISSYHLRLSYPRQGDGPGVDALRRKIVSVRGVSAVVPFIDTQTMIQGRFEDMQACSLRGVRPETGEWDPGLISQLHMIEGDFSFQGGKSLVLGAELADALGVSVGDQVEILSLSGNSLGRLVPEKIPFFVSGIFKSGYYEFDRNLGFIQLHDAEALVPPDEDIIFGIKLVNRYQDQRLIEKLRENIPAVKQYDIVSWREYNKSFFGALRMEKIAMIVLIGLIFIVVGVNIFHSLRRAVFERIEDISLMRSIGASSRQIRYIFIFDGILIGGIGGIAGLLAGFLISNNINLIFHIFEIAANGVLSFIMNLISPFSSSGMTDISVFSPRFYYLNQVPIKLLFSDVLIIFLFALFSAVGAAYFASKKLSEIKPIEVLRSE